MVKLFIVTDLCRIAQSRRGREGVGMCVGGVCMCVCMCVGGGGQGTLTVGEGSEKLTFNKVACFVKKIKKIFS
jgi:hypothetical protein